MSFTTLGWRGLPACAPAFVFLGMATQATVAQGTGWGQITLDNKTAVTLDLFVDGHFGCRALAGLFCTSQEREGGHVCTANAADGRNAGPFPCPIKSGESFTWTVAG